MNWKTLIISYERQVKLANLRIWASLTRAKLWWLESWVRASPKVQLLLCVPSLQWSVSIKSGPRKEHCWIGYRIMGDQGSLHMGERRVARVVQFNRQVTVTQIAEEVNADSNRKVSEYMTHCSFFLCLGLHSYRSVRVPMLTPVHCRKCQQWAHEQQNWTT